MVHGHYKFMVVRLWTDTTVIWCFTTYPEPIRNENSMLAPPHNFFESGLLTNFHSLLRLKGINEDPDTPITFYTRFF